MGWLKEQIYKANSEIPTKVKIGIVFAIFFIYKFYKFLRQILRLLTEAVEEGWRDFTEFFSYSKEIIYFTIFLGFIALIIIFG